MNSEWTFVTAFLFGVMGSLMQHQKFELGVGRDALSLMCIVLVSQKLLETAAKTATWLPQDSEWVKK